MFNEFFVMVGHLTIPQPKKMILLTPIKNFTVQILKLLIKNGIK